MPCNFCADLSLSSPKPVQKGGERERERERVEKSRKEKRKERGSLSFSLSFPFLFHLHLSLFLSLSCCSDALSFHPSFLEKNNKKGGMNLAAHPSRVKEGVFTQRSERSRLIFFFLATAQLPPPRRFFFFDFSFFSRFFNFPYLFRSNAPAEGASRRAARR